MKRSVIKVIEMIALSPPLVYKLIIQTADPYTVYD